MPPSQDTTSIIAAFEQEVAAWPAGEREMALTIVRAMMGDNEAERRRVQEVRTARVLTLPHLSALLRVMRELVDVPKP